jgi:hypothetical protein
MDGSGGGAGYFGGEGGFSDAGAGGGGSGYCNPQYCESFETLTGDDGQSVGNTAQPPRTTDPDYQPLIGTGQASAQNGGQGLIVIEYDPENQPAEPQPTPVINNPSEQEVFTCTGDFALYEVPLDISEITVNIWGAGGAGRDAA